MTSPDSASNPARSAFMYAAGLAFLTLAKVKHGVRGYTSPKPFELSETDRAIAYDLKVVDEWRGHLAGYAGSDDLTGKNIIELGPGSDLGIGLYLLALGARSYGACDVHNLVGHAPRAFYARLVERLRQRLPGIEASRLLQELDLTQSGKAAALGYVVREDFDFTAAFAPRSFDLVFSQAAFEHFDDVETTVARLTRVCRPGAIVVAEIDLKTHSRWIRDHDPNNIYRYPRALYDAFYFRGRPNRWRPYQYVQAFERQGWKDIVVKPLERTAHSRDARGISKSYDEPRNQLDYLSIVLCARNGAAEPVTSA